MVRNELDEGRKTCRAYDSQIVPQAFQVVVKDTGVRVSEMESQLLEAPGERWAVFSPIASPLLLGSCALKGSKNQRISSQQLLQLPRWEMIMSLNWEAVMGEVRNGGGRSRDVDIFIWDVLSSQQVCSTGRQDIIIWGSRDNTYVLVFLTNSNFNSV